MNELIPIAQARIGGETVQTANGRDLHAFLGVRKDYSNWVKQQIERGGFVECVDYVRDHLFAQKGEQQNQWVNDGQKDGAQDSNDAYKGSKVKIEYHFTANACKHIGMMSGTAKGRELREYFIRCEGEFQKLTAPGAKAERNAVLDQEMEAVKLVFRTHGKQAAARTLESMPILSGFLQMGDGPAGGLPAAGVSAASPDALAHATAFVTDCLTVEQGAVTNASDIRKAYLDWCVESDVAPLTQNAIGAAMTKLGYAREKRSGTQRYLGVKIVVAEGDFAEFVRSACETGPAFMASSTALFDAYRFSRPGSKATISAFGRWLTAKGYPWFRNGDHKWRRGLRLKTGGAANGQ